MGENEMMLLGGTSLIKQSELYEPMLYYGATPRIAIEYISDIHLMHHMRYYDNDIRKTVRVIAKSLYGSLCDLTSTFRDGKTSHNMRLLRWNMPVFLGDVSSSKDVTIAFYKQFRMNAMYRQYKLFKRKLASTDDILAYKQKRADAERRSNNLAKYIATKEAEFKCLKDEINKHISYNKVIAPKGNLQEVENYLKSDYYKKRNLPCSVTKKISIAATLKDEISKLGQLKNKLDLWLDTEENPSRITKLRDFKYCSDDTIGLVILGNHEYVDFFDVHEAVEFYKGKLEPLGYIVLQNEYVERDNVVIYGGTGFAKYSEYFNANNIVCCQVMKENRAYEIEQTTLFENGYEAAKRHAKETGKCFICAAHYPVESCLGKFDREAVYFTGHTHKNERVQTKEKTLYADNQVGYHKNGKFDGVIRFKQATTDSAINPYGSFNDGCYQTMPEAYLRFSDYIGEYIGDGKLIRKRCETSELYVIKSQGYYGFFIVNNSGISIVNGGMTKKIALSKNINWVYANFNIVVKKYLAVLEPLRMAQMQISHELKSLGFLGNIHGLIVDIDFYNHVMVNPVNGSITFYYSPMFGQVQQFESFQKQLEFMGYAGLLESKNANQECNELALCGLNMLASVENNGVLDEMVMVSRTMGAYGVSRAVNPLQRLFKGHVLRDFDVRLIETRDESAMSRKVSMCGRVCRDENYRKYLVIKDDLGEFVTLLDKHGKELTTTVLKLRAPTHNKWKWETLSLDDTIAKYGDHGRFLPKAWHDAIRQMRPKELAEKK